MTEEARLIRRIQKRGDMESADMLIRVYYDEIFRYVSRQMNDKADAMDITQEIFVSMLRTIHGYESKKAGFRTWLYRIATNKTIDFFRSREVQTRYISETDEAALTAEDDFLNRISDRELADRVCGYVNALPPDTQQVFRLKFFGGYTFPQIANALSASEATVKSRYYRLIRLLRKEFQNEE